MTSFFASDSAWSASASIGLLPPRSRGGTAGCVDCATRRFCAIGSLSEGTAVLGPRVRERSFRPGDVLSREGETDDHVRILKVGMAFLCRNSVLGASRPIAIVASGTTFGIVGYHGLPNELSVVAASSGRCCELALESVQSLARDYAPLREGLARIHAGAMAMLAMWAAALGSRRGTAQVATSMLLLGGAQHTTSVVIPSHTILAEMLGTTRESVARALAVLETAGCLTRTSLHRCEIEPQALRSWLAAHR